jgi:hypothetical protein
MRWPRGQALFDAISEDLSRGTGKTEGAKLPGAGRIPKHRPMEAQIGYNLPERKL